MVLEIRSFATQELYEEVVPRLEAEGFEGRGDLNWSDPGSDGEYGALYFDYTGEEEMPVDQFAELVRELRAMLEKGGPPGHFNVVDPRHIRRVITPD